MLRELRIENLALIEELHMVFDSRLVAFTGETGAGKSIILQAIDLLAGKRASAALVRNGKPQARVEALFELPDRAGLAEAVREMGIDTEGELLVSRVLSSQGRSRFYINGSLSTAKLAERVSEYLLTVASQHDHQMLLRPRAHLDFIDLAGELWPQRQQVAVLYDQWSEARDSYQALADTEREKEQRRDFLTFQVQEISEARLTQDEDLELEAEKRRLKGADQLRKSGLQSYGLLNGQVADGLSQARKALLAMAEMDPGLEELASTVAEQSFLVEESAMGLRAYVDDLPQDHHRLEEVTARLDLLAKLKRKYGDSLETVINHGRQAEKELAELDSLDRRLEELAEECRLRQAELLEAAGALSRARRQAGDTLGQAIGAELTSLCFEQAAFEVRFNEIDSQDMEKLSRLGWDRPEFLFSANPGEPRKPLNKVASGGELSRLMLALKCILSRQDMVETVLFDEVDAGVGGKAAEAVARKIKELADHHQVMCITHLPQIASCAREHLLVEKKVAEGRTRTTISKLAEQERVTELARMLDGESVSEQSLAFAEELIARHT